MTTVTAVIRIATSAGCKWLWPESKLGSGCVALMSIGPCWLHRGQTLPCNGSHRFDLNQKDSGTDLSIPSPTVSNRKLLGDNPFRQPTIRIEQHRHHHRPVLAYLDRADIAHLGEVGHGSGWALFRLEHLE